MRYAAVVQVESHSSPGRYYRVWIGPDGPIFCDCPAHKFARGGRKPCKHMLAISREEALSEAARSLAGAGATFAPEAVQAVRAFANAAKSSRFALIELQEETAAGWSVVADMRRFNNLEV